MSDADCTQGTNGRCTRITVQGWECTYDDCSTDADCPALEPTGGRQGVCACENGVRSNANVCVYAGNCGTDADCDGGYCSPSGGGCVAIAGFEGFYCHTAADECVDDTDCFDPSVPDKYCGYSTLKGHWECTSVTCIIG